MGLPITVTCPMCRQNMHIKNMGYYACENCDWELWQMEKSTKDKARDMADCFANRNGKKSKKRQVG